MDKPLDVHIRDSRDDDLGAIQKIYAHHVLNSVATFEIEPPDLVEMMRRRAEVLRDGFPYLVAFTVENGHERVVGYAYAYFFKLRPAYRFTAENSIYLDPVAQGSGVGRKLLGQLIERCKLIGMRQMVAVIGDSGNVASIAVHAAAGFRYAGLLRASGWKFDRWVDAVLMQRELGHGDRLPPEVGS